MMLERFVNLILRKEDLFFLAFISFLFLLLVTPNIYYMDLHPDEIDQSLWCIGFIEGKDIIGTHSLDIHISGKRFIVGMVDYLFALPSYMLIPFFMIFGINVISLKMLSISLSLLSLLMLYYICNILFNKKISIITTLLFALSPSFLHFTRMGLYATETILNFFFIAGIFFSILYYYQKRHFCLYLASYLFGAGLSIKLSFLPRLLGLFFVSILFFNKNMLHFVKINLKARHKFGVIIFFCLGAIFFLYFNIVTKGATFKLARYLYTDTRTPCGINNLDFNTNLKIRLADFKKLIREELVNHADGFPFDFKKSFYLTLIKDLVFILFITAALWNLIFAFFYQRDAFKLKKLLSVYIIYMIMLFSICFSPFSFRVLHILSICPFPQLTVAIFVDNLYNMLKRIRPKTIFKNITIGSISLVILAPLLITDIYIISSYHSILKKTGGRGYSPPIIYDILDYIRINKLDEYPVYCMEWQLRTAVGFLTKGEFNFLPGLLTKKEFNFPGFFDYSIPRKALFEMLNVFLSRYERLYFVTDKSSEVFKSLEENIMSLNRKMVLKRAFYNKVYEPQFYLYQVD